MPRATANDAIGRVLAINSELARLRTRYDNEADRLRRKRRRALLEANRTGGLTYDEIVAATGISDGQVAKEIAKARTEAPERLAASPSLAGRGLRSRASGNGR